MPTDNMDRGPVGNRPTPSPGNNEKFWFDDTTGVLYLSNGTQWWEMATGQVVYPVPVGPTITAFDATQGQSEVTISGEDFLTNDVGEVHWVSYSLAETEGGDLNQSQNVFGPNSIYAGGNAPEVTILQWDENTIAFTDTRTDPTYKYIGLATAYNDVVGEVASFSVDPPQQKPEPAGATLVSIMATGNPGEVEVTGTGLDFNPGTLGTIRLHYTGGGGGPYIQFDNWVATGGGTSVIVVNEVLEGATISEVELFDDQIQTNSLTSSTTIPDLPLVLA